MQLPGTLFSPSLPPPPPPQKKKKSTQKKIPHILENRNYLALILKKFLYFRKQRPLPPLLPRPKKKKILIFSPKKAFLIFPETKTTKKLLIFQEVIFQAPKIKISQPLPPPHKKKVPLGISGNGTF